MILKIAEVEKSVLSVEEAMSIKICGVENSMANIREQIKSEIEHVIKIQPKQMSEQTVPAVSYTHLDVYKRQIKYYSN